VSFQTYFSHSSTSRWNVSRGFDETW
jgi:hypothetical protein